MKVFAISVLLVAGLLSGCKGHEPPSPQPGPVVQSQPPVEAPAPVALPPVFYSNMHEDKHDGDFFGTELQLQQTGDRYQMILYCAQGDVEGPIRETLVFRNSRAAIRPVETTCGEIMEFQMTDKGLYLDYGPYTPKEFLPRKDSFLKEELYK